VVIGIDGLEADLVRQFMHERKLPRMPPLARSAAMNDARSLGPARPCRRYRADRVAVHRRADT